MEQAGYIFREERGDGPNPPLLFVFHGTGGDENQIFDLARAVMPGATLLAPRGDVMEGPLRRFFRRYNEQSYDLDDVDRQAKRMARFLKTQVKRIGADRVYGIGYSNGANIIAVTMMEDPTVFDAAVLMHPLIPYDPAPQPGLAGRNVLITAGERDTICSVPNTKRLASWLKGQGATVDVTWHEGGHEIRQVERDAASAFLAARKESAETA